EELPPWARGEGHASDANQAAHQAAPSFTSQAVAQPTHAAFTPAMPQHSFEETPETQEETSRRLRMELELAERQRLVDNLSRLQSEMHTLDIELAREHGGRDLSGAFEVPRVETSSLKKLGEEFRKAVEEGHKSDAREQLFPLEQLSSTISQVVSAAESMANQTLSQATRGADQSSSDGHRSYASQSNDAVLPASFAGRATASTLKQALSQATAVISGAPASPQESRDPVLARALAQQKVQAALRASAQPKPAQATSPELEAARAMAKADAQPKPLTHIVRERTLSGSPKAGEKTVIKTVRFPRLDETDV
ncbi:MAG: hypothetical protein V4760_13760, partial [Bdellovibrionota bacterium]